MRRVPKPSKRVLSVLVGTVFVVAFVIVWTLVSQTRVAVGERAASAGALSPISVSRDPGLSREQDQDQDGLLDWEENLRGTDPKNPDTDGDGTSDGQEVATSRDPLVKGPNDAVADLVASSSAALDAELQAARRPGTLTDNFAQQFAESFASAQLSGQLDQSSQEAMLSSLSNQISTESGAPDRYSATSVATDPSVSLEAYAAWFSETQGDAMKAMGTAAKGTKVPAAVGRGFVALGRALCSRAVPPGLAAMEAEVCNVNDKIGQGILALADGEVDPLRAVAGIATLRAAESRRGAAYGNIAAYLSAHGVNLHDPKYPGFWASAAL